MMSLDLVLIYQTVYCQVNADVRWFPPSGSKGEFPMDALDKRSNNLNKFNYYLIHLTRSILATETEIIARSSIKYYIKNISY
jgi:hypothetical protein